MNRFAFKQVFKPLKFHHEPGGQTIQENDHRHDQCCLDQGRSSVNIGSPAMEPKARMMVTSKIESCRTHVYLSAVETG